MRADSPPAPLRPARADVEARLVEHHHDVRRLRWPACSPRRRRAAGRRRASDSRTPRVQIADRRAPERANLEMYCRARTHFGSLGTANDTPTSPTSSRARRAPRRRRTRNGSNHQISTSTARRPPRRATRQPSAGKIVEQERDRVRVDDHEVDEVDRHEQHIVLEPRQQDQHRRPSERHRCRDGRAAQHDQARRIEQAPGEQEGELRHEARPRCKHDRERGEMKQQQSRGRVREGVRRRTRRREARREQCGRHDTVTQARVRPLAAAAYRCHTTVIIWQTQEGERPGEGRLLWSGVKAGGGPD